MLKLLKLKTTIISKHLRKTNHPTKKFWKKGFLKKLIILNDLVHIGLGVVGGGHN